MSQNSPNPVAEDPKTGALKGVRVLDFGRVVASAWLSTLLADMGADVIKVERPGGEFDRDLGPFAQDGRAIAYELIIPRNKRSITLDIRSEQGKKILAALVKAADMVVTGFSPGASRAMGLDYPSLSRINPGIILVAVTGYGQKGPKAENPAFDLVAQAESGAMSYTGFPNTPPTRAAVPYADLGTAALGAYGAVLALLHRQKTGEGQMVDVSLMDTALSYVAAMGALAEYGLSGRVRSPLGNHSFYNFTDAYKAVDGWVVISVISNPIWERFVTILGRPDLAAHPDFGSDASRFENRDKIRPMVEKWAAVRTTDEIISTLENARVPCGRVNTAEQAAKDPLNFENGSLVNLVYENLGAVTAPGLPVRLSKIPPQKITPAAPAGAHNREVYGALAGLSPDQLDDLEKSGVI